MRPAPNGTGPSVGALEPGSYHISHGNHSTRRDAPPVTPGAVAGYVASAPMAELFGLSDDVADLFDLVSGGDRMESRCPTCRRRSIVIEHALMARCAICSSTWTRGRLAAHVLRDPAAVRRIGARIAGGGR